MLMTIITEYFNLQHKEGITTNIIGVLVLIDC